MKNQEIAEVRRSLPILTTPEDVDSVCSYLVTKPTGATIKDAKAVIDAKHLDPRKITAFKFWGFIDEDSNGKLKLTELGRRLAKTPASNRASIYQELIAVVTPYRAIVERVVHRKEDAVTANDVAAHWHEHFREQTSTSDATLNYQAVCFFQVADAAGLGTLTIGRNGAPTRLAIDHNTAGKFVQDGREEGLSNGTASNGETVASDIGEPELVPVNRLVKGPLSPLLSDSPQLGQAIFIGHGKNRKPLEQLEKILQQFKIPFRVAIDEPNLGRPIGSKVRDLMKACNCAILIFTADEEFRDKDGNVVWRPSENVAHELGAAGYLYDNRIVILKEADVSLPSNFRDIGYISFEKDKLEAKAFEVLKELIGFGIVKVTT
jgi:predicted nucleotide-binding protein